MIPKLLFKVTATLTASTLIASTALADAEDSINMSARYMLQTDSNLFRIASNLSPQTALGTSTKSDTIDITSVGLSWNKSYSLQKFQLTTSIVDSRYKNFDYLNFDALNYSAAWNWSVTPRVRGVLSADRKQALNNTIQFVSVAERNVRTDTALRFNTDVDLGAAVHLIGGVDQARSTNELSVSQEGDSSVRSASLGLRYVFPSGNFVSYRMRQGNGDYYNRAQNTVSAIPNSFDETEHEFRAAWALTGKTALTARLAHFKRNHTGLAQRDYSGPTGDISLNWDVTSKIDLTAVIARTLSAYQTDSSSFIAGNRFTLSPVWRTTAHTSLRFNYDYLTQSYRGALPGSALPGNRQDTTRSSQLALDWSPRQSILLTLALQNQKRSSNVADSDFKSNGASVSAQLNF
nr:XrtB/PEP-CTERM-associated polysaccharide biosynthesis outer membrane protein EpsL [uncultured Albidiferax sp.]